MLLVSSLILGNKEDVFELSHFFFFFPLFFFFFLQCGFEPHFLDGSSQFTKSLFGGIEGLFWGTRIKGRKPNPATKTEKKLTKDRGRKPLSPNGRNNGSQV